MYAIYNRFCLLKTTYVAKLIRNNNIYTFHLNKSRLAIDWQVWNSYIEKKSGE